MRTLWTPMARPALVLWALGLCTWASATPSGLLFHVSFDRLTTTADVAVGSPQSGFTASLELRSEEGVKGAALLQQPKERCTYELPGNLDTARGSYSVWVKPLNWSGDGGKFRHFLVVHGVPDYSMLLYLYPIGDEAVINYIRTHANTPRDATSRAGCPVDILRRGEWTHLVSTWDARQVRLYANGRRVGEGLTAGELPAATSGQFTICPIDWWNNPQWGDPQERTLCDEVRVFDHALSDDEVLDLYAAEVPGGLNLEPGLALALEPDYFGRKMVLNLRAVHLDQAWEADLPGATVDVELTDPTGAQLLAVRGGALQERHVAEVPAWVDGPYTARVTLRANGRALQAQETLEKPPTPWAETRADWKADRVLEPWTPLSVQGHRISYWNGQVSLPGALPEQIHSGKEGILVGPVRLMAEDLATWRPGTLIESEPHRVTFRGEGALGDIGLRYETLMEFDGLIRTDLQITPPEGGIELPALTLEIPIRAEVARYYRDPACSEWDGQSLDEEQFLPYGWLGNEKRGLSWFMESSANWCSGEGEPAVTLRREDEAVVVRLHLISTPTAVQVPLQYTIGLEATPVRPVDPDLYANYFAGGPYTRGATQFVYGWGQQLAALNGRLLAHDPAGQRELVDRWKSRGQHSLSYTCLQCTANISPEYNFFAGEWNQPYGATFSGYKRVGDDAPYSIVPVCPRSSFGEFLLWCVRRHNYNDWGDGIYTDIDGAIPCDNAAHGCGFADAFGRTGRTWPLYAHRGISRRIYAACRDAGKRYYSHAHSHWYSLFNAFNDGWCPGEQYSADVVGRPSFYMTDIPDRVWRSEFVTQSTGVTTFLLPELGRLTDKDALKDRGPSECCIAAAMAYGVPLWTGSINKDVVEEVWDVQREFGIDAAGFAPFWEQADFVCSHPDIRISSWRRPGRRLIVVANFGAEEAQVTLTPTSPEPGVTFAPAWQADSLTVTDGEAHLTVPGYRGALLFAEGMAKPE